jgi:hypothetical protein
MSVLNPKYLMVNFKKKLLKMYKSCMKDISHSNYTWISPFLSLEIFCDLKSHDYILKKTFKVILEYLKQIH